MGSGRRVLVGSGVGVCVCAGRGVSVGSGVGVLVGSKRGVLVGSGLRVLVGAGVGVLEGLARGVLVGSGVGVFVGSGFGVLVGSRFGVSVGAGAGVLVRSATSSTLVSDVSLSREGVLVGRAPAALSAGRVRRSFCSDLGVLVGGMRGLRVEAGVEGRRRSVLARCSTIR